MSLGLQMISYVEVSQQSSKYIYLLTRATCYSHLIIPDFILFLILCEESGTYYYFGSIPGWDKRLLSSLQRPYWIWGPLDVMYNG
jgi:hypothetical protein